MKIKLSPYRITLFLITFSPLIVFSPQATAISGYCMRRNSFAEEWQIETGWNFSTCKQENNYQDGDDIFDSIGLIYWQS